MSKKIHTIQSSDKEEFDTEVNFFLELGFEILEGSYKVVKEDDGDGYSHVVTIDTDKYDVEYHKRVIDNRIFGYWVTQYEDNFMRKMTEWDGIGKKTNEITYKDQERYVKMIDWYENGQKKREVIYNNYDEEEPFTEHYFIGHFDPINGKDTEWGENGQKFYEGTFKDGIGKWTYYYYNEDGTVKEVKEVTDERRKVYNTLSRWRNFIKKRFFNMKNNF